LSDGRRSEDSNRLGAEMIDLYFAATPNGLKVKLFLEEAGLPHAIKPVSLSKGEQFTPAFLAISPNNKIPAIVDHAPGPDHMLRRDHMPSQDHTPSQHQAPITLFESGAILLYLAEKIGRFIPADLAGRAEVLQWLFWQMAGLGPMAGQIGYFNVYASEKVPFAIARYSKETARLYGVLDKRLADREFIAGAYSIADMACYPWIVPHIAQGQDLNAFPHLQRWFNAMAARPATQRTYAGVTDVYSQSSTPLSAEAQKTLFGQSAAPRS
jgi:GSH-dependent disulfide-bond oxidoreductase